MNAAPVDIRDLDRQALTELVVGMGEKPYRARQVWDWLWKKGARSFAAMSDLPKAFREELAAKSRLLPLSLVERQQSKDGTVKCAFRTHDGHLIEGVLIPTSKRLTACISSQIGCSLTCSFCATGKMARVRNLSAGEIVDQVVSINAIAMELHGKPLTNIVYMGMGEPLLNYGEVMTSVEHITAEDGLGMSPRRITISTAGIAKMIKRVADEDRRFNLALSLHAATDAKRDRIMPINEQNSLAALKESLKYYAEKTGRQITFEYILLRDFNDSEADAQDLVRYASDVFAKVNLIEYNPIEAGGHQRTSNDKAEAFRQYLEKKGVDAFLRRSRGRDIDAACGQLANKGKAKAGVSEA